MKYGIRRLDHFGVVASFCRDIGLVETIDEIVGVDPQQKVSTGTSAMAMVINALGFVSKPLYLFPQFMENKPVKILFEQDLKAKDFNDDTLGRALDRIYENDPTSIFMKVAFNATKMIAVERNYFHLDTTSISVHGDYLDSEDDQIPISITHGKSKDKRSDLKQYLVSLITSSKANLPVWIKALSGNTSDKTHFREVINNYAKALADNDETVYFIMDSQMYTKKNIPEISDLVKWISRAPETINRVKELLVETDVDDMKECEDEDLEGYRIKEYSEDYGGIDQKWTVVYSEKSYAREVKTLEKKIQRENEKIEKELWHLGNDEYECKNDALKILKEKEEKWKYHELEGYEWETKNRTGKRGRPKKDSDDIKKVYSMKATFSEDKKAVKNIKKRKGKFIVATNALEVDGEKALQEYKAQQNVERGFRFIKDPLFFASSTFLKKPERIVSLVMVMGLSLLIYSLAQYMLREALKTLNENVKDQKGKPTKTPTMRWIFQVFEGVDVLTINDAGDIKKKVVGIKTEHEKVISLLGPECEKIYFFDRGCGK